MTRNEELTQDTTTIFDTTFTVTPGVVVPTVNDVSLDNNAKDIEAAMLFIDIKKSTHIVDMVQRETAARMYKAFLKGVTRIALANGGDVRSFNGDGVLAVFVGVGKCDNAVRAAMEMKHFFQQTLMPRLEKYKLSNQALRSIQFDFGIGIDLGDILVIKAGIGGENNRDLVWVGSATNHAVKLAAQANGIYHIHISAAIYSKLSDIMKYKEEPAFGNLATLFRKEMWVSHLPLILNGYFGQVYATSYCWIIS